MNRNRMNRLRALGAGAVVAIVASPLTASAQSEDALSEAMLRETIERARVAFGVPGLAAAVIVDGQVRLADGFGMRDLRAGLPMTANTALPIGSCTKAFTGTLAAMLAEDGVLDLDEPLRASIPWFEMDDPVGTQLVTLRDAMSHRTGLPRHDLTWYLTPRDRASLVRGIKELELTAEPREVWQYNNLMFAAAGLAAEIQTGESWDALIEQRIAGPLGMEGVVYDVPSMQQVEHSVGYNGASAEDATPYRMLAGIGPAGSISAPITAMARWAQAHANGGELDGERVLSESVLGDTLRPTMVMPALGAGLLAASGDPTAQLLGHSYTLGWMSSVYRGRQLFEHGGAIDGFGASVSFMPGEKAAVAVMGNRVTAAPTAIYLTVYDAVLGVEDGPDWIEIISGGGGAEGDAAEESEDAADDAADEETTEDDAADEPDADTTSVRALSAYEGVYEHPAYGEYVVTVGEDGKLDVRVGEGEVTLSHEKGDLFRLNMDGPLDGLAFIFQTDVTGEIGVMEAALEPTASPIRFTRTGAAPGSEQDEGPAFKGLYTLNGAVVEVRDVASGEGFEVKVPGQPAYPLRRTRDLEFALELPNDVQGYSMRFELDDTGEIAGGAFVQPNGVFEFGVLDGFDHEVAADVGLESLAGDYMARNGMAFTVAVEGEGGRLRMTAAGQPDSVLQRVAVGERAGAFDVIEPEGMAGFSVRFYSDPESGAVTGLMLEQPVGRFIARRQ